ncbi:MAG: SBBP repeat-containing protein, partial [Bacteroidota bacterium]|nr:SBBP repeat-containing protein [Bacteroidota bacterium]
MIQRALLVAVSSLSLVLLSLPASAQSWLWAKRIGGACYDYYVYPYRVASDAQGNVYVTGYFYYYFTAEGVTYYTYNSGAHADMFVAKYSPTGVLQWVRVGGGTSTEYGYGIGVDANGNVYVTGYYYSNPAVFGSWSLATVTTPDVFLVKYD